MIKIEYDAEDECVTEETSNRLKHAFKDYFEANGVPQKDEEFTDAEILKLANAHAVEFTEAATEFESELQPKL
jgi:hypothetical protein